MPKSNILRQNVGLYIFNNNKGKERQKMEKKTLKKILCSGTALVLAGALCGCSIKFGVNKEPKLDAVVAKATNGENYEEMKITYEDFRKEYKYYLVNSKIEDDKAEDVAATCKQQRTKIINYLINEQVYLQKAKEMGLYELTEEEQKEVDEDVESKIAQQIKYYGEQAEQELIKQSESNTESASASDSSGDTSAESNDTSGEQTSETESVPSMTDEEKEQKGSEMLDSMLSQCGMTRDDLHWWAQSSKIYEKLKAKLGENVSYEDAEEKFKEYQAQAEKLYNSDVDTYQQQYMDQVWLPEGSRLIKHVLLGFDSETQSEIKNLRNDGEDEKADKLRAEKAEELKSKQEEVEKKLDDGEDISKLITEYSADATGSMMYPDGYTVIPNSNQYMEEFQKAAFVPQKIGERTSCVTDYGVHIMVYVGDAKVSEETLKAYTDKIYELLQQNEYAEKMSEWTKEYDFDIDYDALRIDAPTDESSVSSGEESTDNSSEESN